MKERTPPQDLDAELYVLGSLTLNQGYLSAEVFAMLTPADFYHPVHATIFEAMLSLYYNQSPVDYITLKAELIRRGKLEGIGGVSRILQLVNAPANPDFVEEYALIVREKSISRALIEKANKIAGICYESTDSGSGALETAISEFTSLYRNDGNSDWSAAPALGDASFKSIEDKYNDGGGLAGISTGWRSIDFITGGLAPGDLFILGARPSVGKTAWATSLLVNVAKQGLVAGMFSLEMSKDSVQYRIVSAEARVNLSRLRKGTLSDAEWERVGQAHERLHELPYYVDDTSGLPITSLVQRCRKLQRQAGGLDLIVVDYLQLLNPPTGYKGGTTSDDVSEVSKGLKSLAKALSIPVVALCQLNRSLEKRDDKRPFMSDLRGSGSIEQDADAVAFLHREDYFDRKELFEGDEDGTAMPDEVEFIMAKQRNGNTGFVKQGLRLPYCRFDDLETGRY